MSRGLLIVLAGFSIFLITLIPILLSPRSVENGLYMKTGIVALAGGFIAGTIVLAIDKGYSPVFGFILGIFSPIGTILLLLMPDQTKKEPKEPGNFSKWYQSIARGYRIILSGLYVMIVTAIPALLFPNGKIDDLFFGIGIAALLFGMMVGTVFIAIDKGYPAFLGIILGLFSPLGLLILTLLEDQSKTEVTDHDI